MKQNTQRTAQQVSQTPVTKKSEASHREAWEMTAQEALRVDYLTYSRKY